MKPAASDPHSNDKRMGPLAPPLASGDKPRRWPEISAICSSIAFSQMPN